MRLKYAILADRAQVGPDGKISMIGGDFDTIMVARFPAQHPALSLIVQLVVERGEVDREHQLRITLTDPLGETLMQGGGPFTPRLPPGMLSEQPVKSTFVLNMGGLPFVSAGTYRFQIAVNDRSLGNVPLYVRESPVPGSDRFN